jgi:hypothetical protein
MKIKWKFEEDSEEFDGNGNLKPYYKDSEPWKKPNEKPNYFLQSFKVLLVLVLCVTLVIIGLAIQDYYGYNWNQFPGVQAIRNILNIRVKP